jgi:RND superfamily putative drug exporter
MSRGAPTSKSSQSFTGRFAGTAARHPWLTLLAWVVILAAGFVSAGNLSNVLTSDQSYSGQSESARAARLIQQRLRTDNTPQEYVVVEATGTADAAAMSAMVGGLESQFRSFDHVASVASYVDGVPNLVTADGQIALIVVALDGTPNEAATNVEPILDAIATADANPAFRVTTVGDGSLNALFDHLATQTLEHGEMIGVGVALVILLVVFGAAVAAGLPLVLAVFAIVVAMGMTAIAGRVFELSTFVTNIITMIGLAVGIDYSLFIVQRFREERTRGRERVDAIVTAGSTASRAVLFSGIAVVIALSGLLIMPDPMFRSFGLGAILVVVAAVAAALTLLPAVLGLLGDRVNWLTLPVIGRRRLPESTGGVWGVMTRVVTWKPVLSVVLAATVLVGAASIYTTVHLGNGGIDMIPQNYDARHAYDVVDTYFNRGVLTSEIVVDAADVRAFPIQDSIARLRTALAADPAYGESSVEVNPAGDLAVITVGEKTQFSSAAARDALSWLRQQYIPQAFAGTSAQVLVTGATPFEVDGVAETVHYMPIVFAVVLGFSFLLLTLVFRSVVVPLKAVVMNLLSVGAAYGLLVLVFQHGVGADLFGFQRMPVIESWLPLFLFSILFGLSMDYHVFLLSRIKERYDETGDNKGAVEFGLRSTGSIITGAALIMVAVFGGFALGDLAMFQQMGFGLAVAVILDATVVRTVLVPASMELLGDWNWYFPRWLEWLPEIHIEAVQGAVPQAVEPAPVPALVPAVAEFERVARAASEREMEYALIDGGGD